MCAWLTLPGIKSVSTVPACAADAAIKTIAAAQEAVAGLHPPCARMDFDQYTLIATTCTIPAISSMKNSGTCSTRQNENNRAYI